MRRGSLRRGQGLRPQVRRGRQRELDEASPALARDPAQGPDVLPPGAPRLTPPAVAGAVRAGHVHRAEGRRTHHRGGDGRAGALRRRRHAGGPDALPVGGGEARSLACGAAHRGELGRPAPDHAGQVPDTGRDRPVEQRVPGGGVLAQRRPSSAEDGAARRRPGGKRRRRIIDGRGGPQSAARIFMGEVHVPRRRQGHRRERPTGRGVVPRAQAQRRGCVDVGGDRAGVLRGGGSREGRSRARSQCDDFRYLRRGGRGAREGGGAGRHGCASLLVRGRRRRVDGATSGDGGGGRSRKRRAR